jgi:hypothetical protein
MALKTTNKNRKKVAKFRADESSYKTELGKLKPN